MGELDELRSGAGTTTSDVLGANETFHIPDAASVSNAANSVPPVQPSRNDSSGYLDQDDAKERFNRFVDAVQCIVRRVNSSVADDNNETLRQRTSMGPSSLASLAGFSMPQEVQLEAKNDVEDLMNVYRELDWYYVRLQAALERHKPEQVLRERILEIKLELEETDKILLQFARNLSKTRADLSDFQS